MVWGVLGSFVLAAPTVTMNQLEECLDPDRSITGDEFSMLAWYLRADSLIERLEGRRRYSIAGLDAFWVTMSIVMYLIFNTWHGFAWNYRFPSAWEKGMWRASFAILMLYFWLWHLLRNAVQFGFYTVPAVWRSRMSPWRLTLLTLATLEVIVGTMFGTSLRPSWLRGPTGRLPQPREGERRGHDVVLRYGQFLLVALYMTFRVYIMMESLLSLRYAPADLYRVPRWSDLWKPEP